MATEFYKSIPVEIRGKLGEYVENLNTNLKANDLHTFKRLRQLFCFDRTIEGLDFWVEHANNETFPIWSDELNRFVNP